MATGNTAIYTLVHADQGGYTEKMVFDTTHPTFVDLVKKEGLMAFQREDGTYYSDMSAPLPERIFVRDWTQPTMTAQADVVSQQYKIVHADMASMLANPNLGPAERGEIHFAMEYLEDQLSTVVAVAMITRHATKTLVALQNAPCQSENEACGESKVALSCRPEDEVGE